MDDWNVEQHGKSGLTKRVRESQIDDADAEQQTIAFLEKWIPAGQSPMCGNSICQDRRFLARLMPSLEHYFHYRNLNVSRSEEHAELQSLMRSSHAVFWLKKQTHHHTRPTPAITPSPM